MPLGEELENLWNYPLSLTRFRKVAWSGLFFPSVKG